MAAVACASGLTIFSSIKTYKANTVEVPVLMYHHILRDDENSFKGNPSIISLHSFEKQMEILHENNYTTISLKQLEQFLKGRAALPEKSVLITFDDGYKSCNTYAYPVMKKYSFKGAVFVVTAWVKDMPQSFDPDVFQFLSWDEIRSSLDVFEYASHTHNLHYLDDERGSRFLLEPEEIVRKDLEQSRLLLGSRYFAYPYGEYTEAAVEALKSDGFEMAFTMDEGNVKRGDDMMRLKRRIIYPHTTPEEFREIIGLMQ